jgi:hypothetical protein
MGRHAGGAQSSLKLEFERNVKAMAMTFQVLPGMTQPTNGEDPAAKELAVGPGASDSHL